MIGFVKRGADEIVHRAVDDHEGLFAAILHIDHFRHQNPGIADNQASGFGDDLAVEALQFILDDMCIGIRQRRRVVVVAVGNAETAADVDMADRVSVGAQRLDQFAQQPEGILERLQFGDLAADMHVDAGDFDTGQSGGMGIDRAGAFIGNAELVFFLAGGNLGVGARVHVRIDAEGDMRPLAHFHGAQVKDFQLRLGFDVEAVDAGFQRVIHFRHGLADAGKHDAACRHAGCKRPAQFAARHDIDARAELCQRLQHRLVGIGLHGVTDHGVHIGKSA
ncbi:hypothetical protein D3C78_1196930 [compost metagenome]